MGNRAILSRRHGEALSLKYFSFLLFFISGTSSCTNAIVKQDGKGYLSRLHPGSLISLSENSMQFNKTLYLLALLADFLHPVTQLTGELLLL